MSEHQTPGSDIDPTLRLVTVAAEPLDPALFEAAVEHPQAGGRVVFCGVVRDHDGGRGVSALEYHGHPTAASVVARVASEIAARPGVIAVAVSHRIGLLKVGDVALAAAVSAAHRKDAFAACTDLVDEVKRQLPVWKRQVFDDGTDEWVGTA